MISRANIIVLTTRQVIHSGRKLPTAVATTHWLQKNSSYMHGFTLCMSVSSTKDPSHMFKSKNFKRRNKIKDLFRKLFQIQVRSSIPELKNPLYFEMFLTLNL